MNNIFKKLDEEKETKYLKYLVLSYIIVFLLVKLFSFFSDTNQEESIIRDSKYELLNKLDSQLVSIITHGKDSTVKIDSVSIWVQKEIDSAYPQKIDTIKEMNPLIVERNRLKNNQKKINYSLDCLNFKKERFAFYLEKIGYNEYDSIRQIRDSIKFDIMDKLESEIYISNIEVTLLDYIIRYFHLPMLILFPGRWLFNYIRNLNNR